MILKEVLFKRARERVLFLLKSSDKTEQELRRKLKDGGYPKEAADYAIDFLKKSIILSMIRTMDADTWSSIQDGKANGRFGTSCREKDWTKR